MKRILLILLLLLAPPDAWPCDDCLAMLVGEDPEALEVAQESRRALEEARREQALARELSELDRLAILSPAGGEPETVKKVVPARRDALIIIQNGNGSIRVIGWSRPEVAISCTLDRSIALLRASGRADSSEIRIEVEPRGRVLRFMPDGGQGAAPMILDLQRHRERQVHDGWATGVPEVPAVPPTPGAPAIPPTPAAAPTPPTPPAPPARSAPGVPRPVPTPAPAPHGVPYLMGTPAPDEPTDETAVIGPWAPEAELEVYVPRQARVNLETFGADIVTEALEGTIDLNSLQGDMRLGGRFRRVDAECLSCDMEIGPVLEVLRVSNVTGNVSAERVSGLAEVSTVSGDMELVGPALTSGNFNSISGNISFTGSVMKNGALFFETHGGAIDLNLPRGLSAEFDLSTFMGELATNLGARQSEESTRRGGRQVRFMTGGGGSRISIKSFNGDITVNEARR